MDREAWHAAVRGVQPLKREINLNYMQTMEIYFNFLQIKFILKDILRRRRSGHLIKLKG